MFKRLALIVTDCHRKCDFDRKFFMLHFSAAAKWTVW